MTKSMFPLSPNITWLVGSFDKRKGIHHYSKRTINYQLRVAVVGFDHRDNKQQADPQKRVNAGLNNWNPKCKADGMFNYFQRKP